MRPLFFILPFLAFSFQSFSQNLAIGQWNSHFSYNESHSVADSPARIYCAAKNGLFYYDKTDNSISRMNRVTGLSDVNITTIEYDKNLQALFIGYENGNLDVVQNEQVINISDIKRANIIGLKQINKINVFGNLSYLSTSFGIVVVDVAKREVKDTYKIGPNGNELEVFEVTINGNTIVAATKDGVYSANVNNPFLANYNSWTKDLNLPGGKYNTITTFNNKIFVNRNRYPEPDGNLDIIFYHDGNSWNILDTGNTFYVYRLIGTLNRMISVNDFSVSGYDFNLNRVDYIFSQNPAEDRYRDALIDLENNYWMSDNRKGLVKYVGNNTVNHILPNGPATNSVFSLTADNGELWVASGGRSQSAGPLYMNQGVYQYSNRTWNNYQGINSIINWDTIFDPVDMVIDPSDKNHVFVASFGRGVVEMNNGIVTGYYNASNSSLRAIANTDVRVGGLAFDGNNNLWMSNALVDKPISVRKADGSWQSFAFPGVLSTQSQSTKVLVDEFDQKWMILGQSGGLFVFNDNGTLSNSSDDKYRLYSSTTGTGNLPSLGIYSFALDREGELWIGTDKGIAVIYSPGSVFSGSNYDAQQILIQQDGYNQYLLESETVTAIAVDGANRKWFGTAKAGVFLMSADGTEQLAHFDFDNSPLPSNQIMSIAIDHQSGEVFFGTDVGIVSYRGTATEPLPACQDVYAFPNPVKENYNGVIAISGVIGNGNIKITDVAGNVIHQSRAEGSLAIWNGRKLDGEKVKTGVYLVFSTNEDGTQTCMTKILVIN